MKRQTSSGTCTSCGKSYARSAMTRHVRTCGTRGETGSDAFHLIVEGRHNSAYWLQLSVPFATPLQKIDGFLRQIWLECCDHLSAFRIEGLEYASQPLEDVGSRSSRGRAMRAPARAVLTEGMTFTYEYDFGSTTELKIKVAGLRTPRGGKPEIELLARNNPPEIACEGCGKPATQVCSRCVYAGGGWLCDECAGAHKCGEEALLPVLNSPRTGVCAYCG